MQAVGVQTGVIGGPVRKIQPADDDRAPVIRKSVRPVGAMLIRISLADGGGGLDIGMELNDIGVLPGDVLEYAGELVDKPQPK